MKTFEIHISGRVQGVGFRPFVFNLAGRFGVNGYVSNDREGVVIIAQGDRVDDFFQAILSGKPVSSEIMFSEMKETVTDEVFTHFCIKPTADNISVNIPLTPDFAMCGYCAKEMLTTQNRRYFYPFTTCTQCGSRYAIVKKFPFERVNTTVDVFEMCPECYREYTNPEDVRFHSQTNSCPKCGVAIVLKTASGDFIKGTNEHLFYKIASALKAGKIIACKNTAGYLLLCDATNPNAVSELRKRKMRPTKPFAVLFAGVDQAKKYVSLSDVQVTSLTSPESPIVISEVVSKGDLALDEISPEMDTVGVLLPYSGMLKLIMEIHGSPLIATSGNFHGSPISSSAEEAEAALAGIADFFLHHNLEIRHAQDDSVIKFSRKYGQKTVFRRARGFAPNYFFAKELSMFNPDEEKILCLGGDLKNTIAIVPNQHAYISEYIGDVSNYDTYQRLEKTIESYQDIFGFEPKIIVKDMHPNYENQQVLHRFPNAKVFVVQHHKAHFAAILGEKKLWDKAKVLGIIWDGTGYGNSGEIWGSEFFIYENNAIHRCAHLEEFAWILGDKMAKSPKISALSITENDERLRPFFDQNEWKIYTEYISASAIRTSSMGRLFDAAAFVLGYQRDIYFEGEASMWLEKISQSAYNKKPKQEDYLEGLLFENIPSKYLLNKVLQAVENGSPAEEVGLNFHYTLVKAIEKTAGKHFGDEEEKHLAFSGGVWQNTLLIDLAFDVLDGHYILNFHEKLSPNDENISFGQLNYYLRLQ